MAKQKNKKQKYKKSFFFFTYSPLISQQKKDFFYKNPAAQFAFPNFRHKAYFQTKCSFILSHTNNLLADAKS